MLTKKELAMHARRFLISDLGKSGIGWHGRIKERLRRGSIWRWIVPPLEGGAVRNDVGPDTMGRSVQAYAENLGKPESDGLLLLRDEAAAGYDQQSSRCLGIEQRANFFLGASGLTTSLVLANAGVLLGAGNLASPWLQLAAIALGLASFCAIAAGFRAMQATMSTFGRIPPNSVVKISRRSRLSQHEMGRLYIAANFVGAHRETVVGNWKIARLSAARRWFLGTMCAIVLLTVFVLGAAL